MSVYLATVFNWNRWVGFSERPAGRYAASAYLRADAYSGYDRLFQQGTDAGPLIEVACWAHARRYFYDARLTSPGPAQTAMGYIGKLYETEKRAITLEPTERQALRENEANPILDEFHDWLKDQQNQALPKSPMGQALRYTLSNWEALNRWDITESCG